MALIDPDQIFLRPLTTALRDLDNLLVSSPVRRADLAAQVMEATSKVAQAMGLACALGHWTTRTRQGLT